jgi:hypothetical protein
MIESSEMENFYPEFAHPKVNKIGTLQGWRHNRLWTAGGFVIDAIGIDSAKRGAKLDWQRPDLLCPDDIDNEHDTAQAVKKKIKTLTRRLILAGSKELAVICAQNLVHSDSIFSQLADGRATFLARRKVSGPHPALTGFAYETRHGKTVITAGEPTWVGQTVEDCQRIIDDADVESFLIECQHEVDRPTGGAVYREWNEVFHVITQSEFARLFEKKDREGRINGVPCHDEFGNWRLPGKGRCAMAGDFGTTVKHPTVIGSYWRPAQGMPLTDSLFRYREMCRPRYPAPAGAAAEPTTSRRIGIEIHETEFPWREGERMSFRVMSHEASDEMLTLRKDLPDDDDYGPLKFEKWPATDRRNGISLAQNFMGIDLLEPHPFRRNLDGTPLMGRPRFYLVVPDEQGELYFEQRSGVLRSKKAVDEFGQSRFRAEVVKYHYAETQAGVVGKMPFKDFDDAMDELKAMFARWGPKIQPLTEDERLELMLPEKLQKAALDKLSPKDRELSDYTRYTALAAAKEERKKQIPDQRRRSLRSKYRKR